MELVLLPHPRATGHVTGSKQLGDLHSDGRRDSQIMFLKIEKEANLFRSKVNNVEESAPHSDDSTNT